MPEESRVQIDRTRYSGAVRHRLSFALYAASRALISVYKPFLDELGLTFPQYLVMVRLWEGDDIPVGELVEELRIDYGTASPILKRLEQKDLIRRRRAWDDERSVRVHLTEGGRRMHADAERIPARVIEFTGMSDDDLFALRDAANLLRASIEQAQEGLDR